MGGQRPGNRPSLRGGREEMAGRQWFSADECEQKRRETGGFRPNPPGSTQLRSANRRSSVRSQKSQCIISRSYSASTEPLPPA